MLNCIQFHRLVSDWSTIDASRPASRRLPKMPQSNEAEVVRYPGPQATRFDSHKFGPHPGRNGYPDGTVEQKAQSLALMCRKMTPDVVNLLHNIIKGEHPDASVSDQLKAVQLVLDRGFGRAVSVVEMHVTQQPKSVRELTREQLVRLANGEVIELDQTEYTDVTPAPQMEAVK